MKYSKRNRISANRPKLIPDLSSLFHDQISDEKGGVHAGEGFTYQHWWATFKAAELLAIESDFAIGLEVKEDVAVLDSLETPSAVEFFQIKKQERSGVWTWGELNRPSRSGARGRAMLPSIISKLYSRRNSFPPGTTRLRFVSNVAFSVPLAPDGKTNVHSHKCELTEFAASVQDGLRKKIASHLNILEIEVQLENFTLEACNLPVRAPDLAVVGLFCSLSEEGRLPFTLSRPTISARMLASEIQLKASSTDFANTFEKLKKRCISRTSICELLQRVESSGPTHQVVIESAIQRLNQESFPYLMVQAIQKNKIVVCAHLSDRTNVMADELKKAFANARHEMASELEDIAMLGEMMALLVNRVATNDPKLVTGIEAGYLNTLSLLAINHAITFDSTTATSYSKPQKE